MKGTNEARDRRRAERWVDRSGGIPYVPSEAFDLLVKRLAARYRAAMRCLPWLIGVLLAVSLPFAWIAFDGSGAAFAVLGLTAYAICAVGRWNYDRLVGQADARIGHALPQRVSRGTTLTLSTMLGKGRIRSLVTAAAVEAVLAVTWLSFHAGWLALIYAIGFATTLSYAIRGLRWAASRATVAVDGVSLAIDERMRSEEAFSATAPLFLLLYVFPAAAVGGHWPSWLFLAWTGASIINTVCWWIAVTSRPWRPRSVWPVRLTTPPPSAGLP
jgi:hypothetical protein